MITKPRWSFQHPFWLTTSIYPIDNPAQPIILNLKRKTLAFEKLIITLTIDKKYPEPHFTQPDILVQRELMDTAEFHMGTLAGYYIQELNKIVQNQSNSKSFRLMVPEFNLRSWWCQHLFFITSGAKFLIFNHWRCQ